MGMTNGEKFKEVFGISQVDEGELYAFAWLPNHDVPAEFIIDWWNAEYKAKGVLSKFNKITKTITPQEPKTGHYEKHIDHTDCIWYGSDSGCPVTCSQYRDGWNDAMDYIFKNGKGYQPYRHDG